MSDMKAVASTSIASASFVAFISGCASVGMAPVVPENLKAPATQTLAVVAQASGAQIYECNAGKTDSARFEWVFKAPEAELLDSGGKRIGKHYAGPTWESDDGSKVVGEVKARDDGPDVSAIPWLLLSAKSADGNGIFGKTQSIQRVNTVGGKAPADGCKQAQLGKSVRVAYRATYNFYVARQ
jgi:Protein of unknown function (DUF3455)